MVFLKNPAHAHRDFHLRIEYFSIVIPACRESFRFPLRKGGQRGLIKKDSGQARMTARRSKYEFFEEQADLVRVSLKNLKELKDTLLSNYRGTIVLSAP
jgi:hypothetical protein